MAGSARRGVAHGRQSKPRGAPTCLECPGRADRQSVGVAELRTDPLVLGAKRESPGLGLHSDSVSESVVGLILAEETFVRVGTSHGGRTSESGDVGLQAGDAGFGEDVEERYRQRQIADAEQCRRARVRIESVRGEAVATVAVVRMTEID